MIASIAEYYAEEMDSWKNNIAYHLQENEALKVKLETVLQLNTVIHLAAKVEHNIYELQLISHSFSDVHESIEHVEKQYYEEQGFIGNEKITDDMINRQKSLRKQLKDIEVESINTHFACAEFLSETITAQNKTKRTDSH